MVTSYQSQNTNTSTNASKSCSHTGCIRNNKIADGSGGQDEVGRGEGPARPGEES